MKKILFSIIIICFVFLGMSFYSPKKINSDGNNKESEAYIDSMMQNALEKGFFPGAQVIVGTGDFN